MRSLILSFASFAGLIFAIGIVGCTENETDTAEETGVADSSDSSVE
mgnify:CR=1 FL=1